MITVRLEERGVTVSGHAGYAGRGQDIVCAAVSAVLYVQVRLLQRDNALEDLHVEDGLVRLRLREGARCDALELGARWIAGEYPRCVQVISQTQAAVAQ